MPYDVFISHTEEDQQIALAACEALEREGITCWIAPRNVARGTEWAEAIIGAIKQSRALLLIFSSNANNSHHITNEVAHASELRLRIFTFRIEQVDPIRSLEYYIDKLQWLNAFDSAPENYVPQLVADIRGFLTGPTDSEPPPPKPPIRPAIASFPKWWMWVAA